MKFKVTRFAGDGTTSTGIVQAGTVDEAITVYAASIPTPLIAGDEYRVMTRVRIALQLQESASE